MVSLYNATYGMLFFGTPHKGMMVEDIKKMVTDQYDHPRQTLLDQISNKSNALIADLSHFKNIVRDRKIVSFYEQMQTKALKQVRAVSRQSKRQW